MTRRKQKARPQEENGGQSHPNEPRSQGLPRRKATGPGEKRQNVTSKTHSQAQKQRPQQVSSHNSSKTVQDGSALARSSVSASPVVPSREGGSSNLPCRPGFRLSTEGEAPERPSLSVSNQGRSSNVRTPSFVSSPSTTGDSKPAQRQTRRRGGRPGFPPAANCFPLYSRPTEPLLPCSVDGVDANELRKFQTLAGSEPTGLKMDTSLNQRSHSRILKESPEYMSDLRSFLAKNDELQQKGYVVEPLSHEDLERKKRCDGCNRMMRQRGPKEPGKGAGRKAEKPTEPGQSSHELSIPPLVGESEEMDNKASKVEKEAIIRCKFHPGAVMSKKWTCCGKHVSSDPCSGRPHHGARQYLQGEIERLWQFHETPASCNASEIRSAVAIDCEMGSARSGDSELIRITLIDYFSSCTLIDSLVYPDVPMEHYRSRFSGVTWKDMETARKRRTCINGRDNARRAVWKFVGPATIVVGHSANHDLEALRWIHPVVVDTFLIESRLIEDQKDAEPTEKDEMPEDKREQSPALEQPSPALPTDPNAVDNNKNKEGGRRQKSKGSGQLSLKTLALTRLGKEIQNGGKNGHDSLEDARAARDLVHWHVVNSKESGSKT